MIIKQAILDEVEDVPVLVQEDELLVYKQPVNLFKEERVKAVCDWLEEVLTFAYPIPIQIKQLQLLSKYPNEPLTQVLLGVCEYYDICQCPLMFSSIGCLEFIPEPIVAEPGKLSKLPKPLDKRKCIMRAMSYIRQYLKIEDYAEWREKLQRALVSERMEVGDYA